MFDGEAFGQQMVEIVRGYVDAEVTQLRAENAALMARIGALETRELVLPEKGDPGERGEPGEPGQPGRDGEPGKDGVGLADAFEDNEGRLVLTMTNGMTKTLSVIRGRDGEPGKDGTDGITPEFMDADFEGRILRLTFGEGERTKTVEFRLAVPDYVGVFKDGETYEPGDIVTWAGSAWHCDEPKGLKPGEADSGWRLMVKAGRPGKDAK